MNASRPRSLGLAATLLLTGAACSLNCGGEPSPPHIDAVDPAIGPGGTPFVLELRGQDFGPDAVVHFDGAPLDLDSATEDTLRALVPATARGKYPVQVKSEVGDSDEVEVEVANTPPAILDPGAQLAAVGDRLEVQLETADFDQDPVTLSLGGLPQGALLEPMRSLLQFAPTDAHADQRFTITASASDGFDTVSVQFEIEVVRVLPSLQIDALEPTSGPGGEDFTLVITGRGFSPGTFATLDGVPLASEVRSSTRLQAFVPASPRGSYEIAVGRRDERSAALPFEIGNAPPRLVLPFEPRIEEREEARIDIAASDLDDDPVRIFVFDLPPGARYEASTSQLVFRPDFIQGGDRFVVSAAASDGTDTSTETFTLVVADTIQPPAPEIVSSDDQGDHTRLVLAQRTDDFLDSPGHAGRSFEARVSVPSAASPTNQLPVRVFLHGFGGSPFTGGQGDQFRIYPHDPENTYWWGYSASAPGAVTPGPVPPYTARRILHLVEWVLRSYPGADPGRVYVNGTSMGGAGGAALGLLWARHFAMVETSLGQMVARNHRPSRIGQLSGHYGSTQDNLLDDLGIPVWDRLDLVRALTELPEARHQFLFSRHAKDDPTIHFGAAIIDSPLVGMSWLEALQANHVGHFAVWDEGAHGPPDPVMDRLWWDGGWDRMTDPETWLRSDRAFVAFSASEADDDPGDGSGNGNQPWSDERGYAGDLATPGDTGWSGDVVGAFNRYLRWDSRGIEDTPTRFSVPLRMKTGPGAPSPQPGYPPRGDRYDGPTPVRADVTPRRMQAFLTQPGERVLWRYGELSGEVTADATGAVTVPALPLDDTWTTLELTR